MAKMGKFVVHTSCTFTDYFRFSIKLFLGPLLENLEIAITRIKNSQHSAVNWTNLNYFPAVLNRRLTHD